MPDRFVASVVSKRTHGCATELVLETPIEFHAEPGQFLHVSCGHESGIIMRRPYSLYDARDGGASLLVKKVGVGSAWLVEREVGDGIDCLGPLGKGFTLPSRPVGEGFILVAGGMGVAPLHFLEKRMKSLGLGAVVYWGMERGDMYGGLPGMLEKEMDLRPASLDGGMGYKGNVLELFIKTVEADPFGVYACGPKGMLASLAETIDNRECGIFQVSLEERMACGVGACRGCAVPSTVPDGGYLAVCKDGPVFDGRELDWSRIGGLIPE